MIDNLRFQLKKQNKSNVNKYSKQCTNTKAIYYFDLLMHEKELLLITKLERLKC